jgi:hypothetical protein
MHGALRNTAPSAAKSANGNKEKEIKNKRENKRKKKGTEGETKVG